MFVVMCGVQCLPNIVHNVMDKSSILVLPEPKNLVPVDLGIVHVLLGVQVEISCLFDTKF